MRILAGDVGGTHARLALFESGGRDAAVGGPAAGAGPEAGADRKGRRIPGAEGRLSLVEARVYDSRSYEGLVPVVSDFLSGLDSPPDAACVGIACPITGGICRLPNLDWEVDARTFAEDIGIPGARLINDFDAVGHGLTCLEKEDVAELQPGQPHPRGTIAVIGAGTGLGVGYLTWREDGYAVHPSEGGHVDFAPRTALEAELLFHLAGIYGHVSYERVVSGPGLVSVYEFLAQRGDLQERDELRRELEAGDAARVISAHGVAGDDEICVRALDIFVSAFGAQAGNLALTVQSEGGLYVAGGIAPAILEKLEDGTFLEAFLDKGRMRSLMERMPLRVVLNDQVGLLGAAAVAARG